jgi:ribonuclease I
MKKIDDSYSFFISLACMAMNCESSNTYNLVCHGLWQQKSKIVDKPFQFISKEEHEVVLKYEINLLNAIVKKVREKKF